MLASLAVGFSALGVGFVSALVPVVNAEAAVLGVAVTSTQMTVVVAAIAVAFGQTVGKLVIFELARRGIRERQWTRQAYRPRHRTSPQHGWQARAVARLQSRGSGNAVVLTSASLGLPPLLVVSAAAGAGTTRARDFAVCCLAGRSVRFLAAGLGVGAVWPGLPF